MLGTGVGQGEITIRPITSIEMREDITNDLPIVFNGACHPVYQSHYTIGI